MENSGPGKGSLKSLFRRGIGRDENEVNEEEPTLKSSYHPRSKKQAVLRVVVPHKGVKSPVSNRK